MVTASLDVSSAAAAVPISREVACRLLRDEDDPRESDSAGSDSLPALLAAAQCARTKFKPGVITYSRKVFLPLTNLCRDYCGYCIFRRDPGEPGAHTMSPDEVMEVVRAGERMGCTEALFSLGDKPEALFPEMRETLRDFGYKSTLQYLEAMCDRVLRESSLFPHPNPGIMSAEWLERLSRVAPSMGLMLESTSTRLLAKGSAHDNAPDKDPAKRLRVMEDAGRLGIPFTTGILIGIGETAGERVDSLIAIRDLQEKYGHIQEVIVQNFRAKAGTPMASWPEPNRREMLRTLAVARLLMPNMNIQAPPNLSDPHYADLLDAGINDWGGISPLTPDFINPEKPWPQLRDLEERTEARGFKLRQRLPVYPEYMEQAAVHSELLAKRLHTTPAAADYGRRTA
jgi:7,8-didemethyl-8-hydroxy-5-deazariboflavin synthase CofG subunit